MSFKTLNIGTTALMAQKLGLDITGQNIANASTPGYARQRVNQEAVKPYVMPYGAVGQGVEIKSIKQIADPFLEKQVRLAFSSHERLSTLQDAYETLEVFFNEMTENDLSTAMDNFWNALSDFNNNVEDISTRRTVLEQAKTLCDTFYTMDAKIRDLRTRQNEEIVTTVGDINSLLTQIATLNRDIMKMESGGATGVTANDLRDQRNVRLKELAGYMDITVTDEPNGSVTVTQRSRLLVFQDKYYSLTTDRKLSDDLLIDNVVFSEDHDELVLGDGKLYAMIEIRDKLLYDFKQSLDQLAASFAWEFNRVHSQNIGLQGFTSLTGTTAVDNPSATLNNLSYSFKPKSGTYTITNGNLEIIVHNTQSGKDLVRNIEIDVDGNSNYPDTILYDSTNPQAGHSLVKKLQDAFDLIAKGVFTVDLDLSNHLRIRSNQSEYVFGFGRDTSGVLAALGLNTIFTGYNANTIAVDSRLDANPALLGGARSFVPGDQRGALALLALRNQRVLDNGSTTFDDYYEGIVGRLGIEGARIDSLFETQQDILKRMENQREALSGVNLDEELTKLILYQRAFQSAARFITTADSIYESLINM